MATCISASVLALQRASLCFLQHTGTVSEPTSPRAARGEQLCTHGRYSRFPSVRCWPTGPGLPMLPLHPEAPGIVVPALQGRPHPHRRSRTSSSSLWSRSSSSPPWEQDVLILMMREGHPYPHFGAGRPHPHHRKVHGVGLCKSACACAQAKNCAA